MAYGIVFKADCNTTVLYFESVWEGSARRNFKRKEIKRLGRRFVKFACGRRKRFTYKLGRGAERVTVRCRHADTPLVSFEYTEKHPFFEKPCNTTFYYDGFSLSELESFGRELIGFKDRPYASVGSF